MNPLVFVRSLLVVTLLFMCSLLTGCSSKVEINERAFVSSIYVDKAEKPGEVELTISVPLPNRMAGENTGGGGGGGRPYAVFTKTGTSLTDAAEKLQTDLTRKLSWGHARVVVFGREYAQAGIGDTIEWLFREPLFHINSYIFVAPGKAKDITSLTPVAETTPGEVLREFANQRNLLQTQIRDVLMAEADNQGFVVSLLNMQNEKMISENNENMNWVGLQGAAMFKNMKMVGELDLDEARVIAWTRNNLKTASITIVNKKEKASVSLYAIKSDLNAHMSQGKPVFSIHLSAKGQLRSIYPPHKAEEIRRIQQIEKELETHVNDLLLSALHKARAHEADILMSGYRLEWKYPHIWDKLRPHWAQHFKEDIQFKVISDISIQYFGSEFRT